MQHQTIAVLCGGPSSEHQVSLTSGRNIFQAFQNTSHSVSLIAISQEGHWHYSKDLSILQNADSIQNIQINPDAPKVELKAKGVLVDAQTQETLDHIDVCFPITHGVYGEDGRLQGLLEFLEVPYVGPNVLGSAIAMDKDITKRLLRDSGLPIVPYLIATRIQKVSFDEAQKALGSPLFLKPARQGSSVGVFKVSEEAEFEHQLSEALQYDTKVLIEAAVVAQELECAVLGNEDPQAAEVLGEIIPRADFYSYDDKYGDAGADLQMPANVSESMKQQLRQAAIQCFQTLECEGMARVDFFVTADQQFFINEVNTLPGFTAISMYPKLWEASGKPMSVLCEALVGFALQRHQRQLKH